MKKILKLFFAVVIAGAFGCLAACGDADVGSKAELVESTSQLVVIKGLKTDNELSVADVLSAFKEEGKLDFEGSISDTGLYLTAVNGYKPDSSKNEFWGVYTTLDDTTYSNTDWTYEYDGKICYSAVLGVSGLPIVEGELYIITLSTW